MYSQNLSSPLLLQESDEKSEILTGQNKDIDLFKQLESLQKKIEELEQGKAKTTFTDLTKQKDIASKNGESHPNLNNSPLPIGFFSLEERQVQQKNLFKQPQEVFKQTLYQLC